jgi:acyl-CoA synthetase (AMP-forming)/AMP-acid ligase II
VNLAELLQRQAAARPDAIAIVDARRDQERRHRYAKLEADAARAAALLKHHGIGKGDRILVLQPMSYELYVALLAVFRLGAVAMFLDPSAGREHIEQCCEIGNPRAFIGSARAQLLRLKSRALRGIPTKFVVGRWAPGALAFSHLQGFAPLEAIEPCAPDDPALLTFTSGSTGSPKAALRSQGFLFAQHAALEHALALRPEQIDLTTLPIFLLANLASGLTSVIPDADLRYPGEIEASPVVRQMHRLLINRSAGSPAFYQRLVDYCEQTPDAHFPDLRRVEMGGAPVFPPLLECVQKIAPNAEVVAVYGSTEAEPMAHIAWTEMDEEDLKTMRVGRGLLAGLPVPEVTLRILEDRFGEPMGTFTRDALEGACLPAGEIGEIAVSGAHVLPGYLDGVGDAETKFEVDGTRWHRTGDAGYLDASGRLWLVGRCSARIEDARGTLYPFTVECAAQFVPGVKRSAMVAHEGQRILLVEAVRGFNQGALSVALVWAKLDDIRVVPKIPVDNRHNAKVDYTQVKTLLRAN